MHEIHLFGNFVPKKAKYLILGWKILLQHNIIPAWKEKEPYTKKKNILSVDHA